MSKKCCLKGDFDNQHGKRAQALWKSMSQHLYHIHWSLPSQLSSKTCLLLTCKFLVLLVKTLAADKKYPVLNRNNLTIPVPKQLLQEQKIFSQFFHAFLKCRVIFNHFETKMIFIAFVFPNLRTPQTLLDKCRKTPA